MRRLFITIVTIFILIASFALQSALADVDLSGMSFDELVALRNQIDQAIWASDGWQEVEVPSGVYIIGEDIPEGRWSIKCNGKGGGIYTLYPDKESYLDNGLGYIAMKFFNGEDIMNVILDNGQYLELSASTYTFSPMIGADLGFK